mmetsp:Transcript_85625/g.228319  ORF Transcript_85625/g.228319 Transcript_85625/m.228319 type:complete len:89 (+) Transcript_85625:593-859(+)
MHGKCGKFSAVALLSQQFLPSLYRGDDLYVDETISSLLPVVQISVRHYGPSLVDAGGVNQRPHHLKIHTSAWRVACRAVLLSCSCISV